MMVVIINFLTGSGIMTDYCTMWQSEPPGNNVCASFLDCMWQYLHTTTHKKYFIGGACGLDDVEVLSSLGRCGVILGGCRTFDNCVDNLLEQGFLMSFSFSFLEGRQRQWRCS